MPPVRAPDAAAVLSTECLVALDRLRPVEVVAGVHVLDRASPIATLLDTVEASLGKHVPSLRAAVLVADGGSRDGSADVVRAWCDAEPRGSTRRPVALVPPLDPGRALLGLLAAAHRVGARGVVVLDAELATIHPDGIAALIEPVLSGDADYVAPAYSRAASEGTLTTNLLAPLAGALYGKRLQQVAGGCAALARPLVERCLGECLEVTMPHAAAAEIALTVAALTSGARVVEAHLGRRPVDPGAPPPDLATTLVRTVGPLYASMERYHDVWETTRGSVAVPRVGEAPVVLPEPPRPSVERMVRAFDLGLKDLLPVWEQILTETTLEQLYPLALLEPTEFDLPPALWARVASDFALAYHERQLPRDQLIRALTPLYLGRVAAFLREAWRASPSGLPGIFDRIGRAFEVEKESLDARWR